MVKPFNITFTALAQAAAAASSSLAAVEAKCRADLDKWVLWTGSYGEIDLPPGGFLAFAMDDQDYICWFAGPSSAEIDAVSHHESLGPIESKADWLGLTGEITLPVPATRKP